MERRNFIREFMEGVLMVVSSALVTWTFALMMVLLSK